MTNNSCRNLHENELTGNIPLTLFSLNLKYLFDFIVLFLPKLALMEG